MSKRAFIFLIVLAALALAYAVVLQIAGQPADAREFVSGASGTLIFLAFFAWTFEW